MNRVDVSEAISCCKEQLLSPIQTWYVINQLQFFSHHHVSQVSKIIEIHNLIVSLVITKQQHLNFCTLTQ